jgi:uncharacterized protein YndB with AHSA1/START domain
MPARARVLRLGDANLLLVAGRALRQRGSRAGRVLRAPPRRADLRAHPAGAEHDWGEVLEWEPPHRLAYSWHLRQDRVDATRVEISFAPDPEGTRVRIVHAGWERLGARGAPLRDRHRRGWSGLIPHYARAAAEAG